MRDSTEHHVIVGGSAAGVAAALALRDHGFAGRVSVVDAGGELPYERPPLSKALLAGEAQFVVPIVPAGVYTERDIDLLLGTRVLALDAAQRLVVLDDGRTLRADRVLLATGARALLPEVSGVQLSGVLTLRDAQDGRELSARLACGGPVVVVGGGFIGLEIAAVAREAGLEVTVVEQAPLPLERPLGPELAARVTGLHASQGVSIRCGLSVLEFTGVEAVDGVRLSTGEVLPAATVVVGVGVRPDTTLAERAGVACDQGVIVDLQCRTSDPWIFAAGDVARQPNPHLAGPGRIEHWDNAQKQGAVAGAVMAGATDREHTDLPYFYSHQYGRTLQMYGRFAAGDTFVLRADATPDSFLGCWLRDGRVTAAAALDRPKDLRTVRTLIETAAPVTAAELVSPDTNLRALAKSAKAFKPPEQSLAAEAGVV
ncbi:NAD(P)/FAD-dependent oxidoreductase [Streptomyces sp. NPDC090088]|uniref:NAD(P)/FAD-dependent oxidoreductase n=1 Tax=Streptomyces sp. NPDC090088 TaxID=3365944 RepID=UPI00381134AB